MGEAWAFAMHERRPRRCGRWTVSCPGIPSFYGNLAGDTLTGTTRIGLAAASQIMTQPGNSMCRDFVAAIEDSPAKWTYGAQGCATYTVPDAPPRRVGGNQVFEMVRAAGK